MTVRRKPQTATPSRSGRSTATARKAGAAGKAVPTLVPAVAPKTSAPRTAPHRRKEPVSASAVSSFADPTLAESQARDRELVVAVKAGDQEAFAELWLKYETRVYNHCMRMLGDEHDSMDLTQDVGIKVIRNIKNYQHTYAFYTWLYRITVNCCIDAIRKKRRHAPEVSLTPHGDEESGDQPRENSIPDETFVPDKALLNQELSDVMNGAIGQLSEKLRAIIVLKEVDGFSYDEIAAILGCSRGTVKSRLFRARERLKEMLKGYVAD
jgi:RNA polymerase sigma-70 factor (ECF subfamily)